MNEKYSKNRILQKDCANHKNAHSESDLKEQLKNYHDNDIAQSFELLNSTERSFIYDAIGIKWLASIISYIDNPSEYTDEIGVERLAKS